MSHSITASELRSRYLDFFAQRGHVVIPSASLVPANDPTVLFTTAGMHPLVPYLLGEPHPAGRRLVNVQRCVRTGDIDVIGDDTHLTYFEMLGNWSLGDYGREQAIRWSFEFLTRDLRLPLDRLMVTCFAGDDEVPRDDESIAIWRALGMERITLLGRDDNWWGPAGQTGPCGPDTEIFYWTGSQWVEIWNNVFMQYTKTAAGTIEPLPVLNVDTGMGVERTLVALNGLTSVYEVDTVRPLLDTLRGLASAPRERELRVIADHVRAASAILEDGVGPSNKDRGYVLRRLLRRSILFARQLGMPSDWYRSVVDRDEVRDEAARFERSLENGLRVLGKLSSLDGKVAFDLFQTYGFPFELTRELAEASGKQVDEEGFRAELERHRERSRTTSAGAFEGGLADHSAEIVRYHTLTHLVHAALRRVLGEHVVQRGSNITRERLRFDFPHDRKLTREQLDRVQAIVNGWLARRLVVDRATMPEAAARALGAIGAFGEKYGETVSVYTVTDADTGEVVSREFCGGPHVATSDELRGTFQIVREEAVSAGIRRIKAVLR